MDSINNACKFGGDAWLELQAFKTRQLNRREKLNRHKTLHKDLIDGIPLNHQSPLMAATSSALDNSATINNNNNNNSPNCSYNQSNEPSANSSKCSGGSSLDLVVEVDDCTSDHANSGNLNSTTGASVPDIESPPTRTASEDINRTSASSLDIPDGNLGVNLELVECLLLLKLCDVALKLPIDSRSLQRSICKIRGLENTTQPIIENLLQKFAHQELISIDEPAAALLKRKKRQNNHHHHGPPNEKDLDDEACIYVTSADHTKLIEFDKSFGSLENIRALLIEQSKGDEECNLSSPVPVQNVRTSLASQSKKHDEHLKVNQLDSKQSNRIQTTNANNGLGQSKINSCDAKNQSQGDDLESLLSLSSTKERESKKLGEELLELLSKPTAKERNLIERFRSADGYQVQEFCPKGTKGECNRNNKGAGACTKLHFKKIIAKHTEESLGDCSFLNTCFHMDSCKYVHYEVDYDQKQPQQQHEFKRPHPADTSSRHHQNSNSNCNEQPHKAKTDKSSKSQAASCNKISNQTPSTSTLGLSIASDNGIMYTLSPEEQARIDAKNRKRFKTVLYPPQWIQCDLRFFDMSLLGKFSVVMADPPWDIHMELPYGTMSDDEMRKLNIPALQDEGVIFLWVTGRAMELGRECLALWGYERCDEIIWVKTNQLQRIIRTGRTGHWLNHGKEHCLVGVKGNPKDINRGLDCDVIVAEVRATSHKPDEIYGIIERLSPGTRKIELFGRAHNVQPNWITLGNQLNGVRLIEPNLVNAFKKLKLPFQKAESGT